MKNVGVNIKSQKIKLGVIGLGLIGSSILKGLTKSHNYEDTYEIYCYSDSSYKKALEYTPFASNDLNIIKNCDIVFVCSVVSKTIDYLNQLNLILDKNTLVADVCSIKKDLLTLNKDNFNFDFILTHPMAGSDKTGFDSGDAELFNDAKWLIENSKTEKNNPILSKIINDLGAKKVIVDMAYHDALCAQISHFPTILSYLLYNCAGFEAKKIASSGFRDTTRLAMTNSDLSLNMLNLNLDNISIMMEKINSEFNKLKNMNDSEKIKFFETITESRKQMYDKQGKNAL